MNNQGLESFGEQLLLSTCPQLEKYVENDSSVLIVKADLRKVRLISDISYHYKTQNFFMERYSINHTKAPGGPWQALEEGADIFIYLFVRNKVAYIFEDVPYLVEKLERVIKDNHLRLDYKRQRKYYASGFKIKRNLLEECYTRITLDEGLIL